MDEHTLLQRIVVDPGIFGGKPIIRGRRLAVEHVLEMLAAGTTADELIEGFDWLEADDLQACLLFAAKALANEHYEPNFVGSVK